jgi:hypothetical protein
MRFWKSLSICGFTSAIFLWACLSCLTAQQPSGAPLVPLTPDELIFLCARPIFRDHPERVLNDFVRKNKIAFLPTKREITFLLQNGVPKSITDELKFNFASRIMYRVCEFEASKAEDRSFTQVLDTQLETTRFVLKAPGSLLFDKTFNPVTCPASGPSQEDIQQFPHVGYVLIMGAVDPDKDNPNNRTITARLVFVSKEQQKTSITTPLVITVKSDEFSRAARQIAEWSIRTVEGEVQ